MMRIVDVLLAIPTLVLLLVIAAIFKPSLLMLILIISALSWLAPARLVRAETLSLRQREYVEAIRQAGGTRRRIVLRHIIPNALGVIVVNATFQVADAVLLHRRAQLPRARAAAARRELGWHPVRRAELPL